VETFKRYRVKSASKSWTDNGPDLLRKRADAEKAVGRIIALGTRQLRVRSRGKDGAWTEWSRPMSRKRALKRLHGWEPRGDYFQIGKGKPGAIEVKAVVKVERVRYHELENASPDTCVTWSLIAHQFPNVVYAGAYVWKEVLGTSSWSDHAWGTAVDGTPRGKGATNDSLFDWQCRMGKTGNLPVHGYILGSKGGKVKRANAPGFRALPSAASTSHLWHNHDSIVDHHGAKPPRQGGVW
jgi:hypothetical protein